MPASSRSIAFATGNHGKVLEARFILSAFGIRPCVLKGKGTEVQASTVSTVAACSAREASRRYGRALIVEDAGLFVDVLGGFPGPFSSYAFQTIGIPGLLRLLQNESLRTASFKSAVAYCEPLGEPVVFDGLVAGRILEAPAGSGGFGFDPVFLPGGEKKSMAQMTLAEKCKVSHRGEAMRRFASWFTRDEG